MHEKEIEAKARKLPEDLRKEFLDYIKFLLSKYERKKIKKRKFNFNWEGGLSKIKDKFASVELQHKALE